MQTSIIKDTIILDKEAKLRVALLKEEKLNVDDRIKKDEKTLISDMKTDIAQLVLETKAKFDAQLYTRQSAESLEYKQVLDEMNDHYKEKQKAWINEIVEFCEKWFHERIDW